jgi:parallel beta-helix repeat protein
MSIGAALVWQGDPIASDDVVVANIVSTNNRRQGLSIGRGNNIKIRDSEFSNSNGTAPECGIDIEPDDPGVSNKVSIENCVLRGNRRYGLLAYKRSQNTTIRRCTVENNGSCGIVTVGTSAMYIALCTVRYNSATGIYIQDGTSNCQISQNTFYGNYARQGIVDRTDFSQDGLSTKVQKDILVKSTVTSDIRVTTNFYK